MDILTNPWRAKLDARMKKTDKVQHRVAGALVGMTVAGMAFGALLTSINAVVLGPMMLIAVAIIGAYIHTWVFYALLAMVSEQMLGELQKQHDTVMRQQRELRNNDERE